MHSTMCEYGTYVFRHSYKADMMILPSHPHPHPHPHPATPPFPVFLV